jgi:hypothetical protein
MILSEFICWLAHLPLIFSCVRRTFTIVGETCLYRSSNSVDKNVPNHIFAIFHLSLTNTYTPMKNVFVYGTLLDDRIAKGLLGRLPKHVPARLHDFARYRVNKAAFPAIVTQQQSCVDGRVSLITVSGKWFAWAFSGSSDCCSPMHCLIHILIILFSFSTHKIFR